MLIIGIEVDVIQLTPLTLYNFIVHDQFSDLPPADEYDPDDPPESVVLLSLGCETTDLVVTNGYKVWQRSIPIDSDNQGAWPRLNRYIGFIPLDQ